MAARTAMLDTHCSGLSCCRLTGSKAPNLAKCLNSADRSYVKPAGVTTGSRNGSIVSLHCAESLNFQLGRPLVSSLVAAETRRASAGIEPQPCHQAGRMCSANRMCECGAPHAAGLSLPSLSHGALRLPTEPTPHIALLVVAQAAPRLTSRWFECTITSVTIVVPHQ